MFFALFKKYWPAYDGTIYLNTETKLFSYEGLDIRCTMVGKLRNFGETFRAGLDKIDSPHVLLIMIDYFFMGEVNENELRGYFEYFKEKNLDSLCLRKNPYTTIQKLDYKDLNLVIPPSRDMFSFQIAFWKREMLYEMVLPHETPWLSEWFGTLRGNVIKLKLAYTANNNTAISYLSEGALHKGKWVEPMVKFLNEISYEVDFSKRGFFEDKPLAFRERLKRRINTLIPRSLSSLDLLRRKIYKK
ncbi:hypothetical protein GCM10011379_00130 [Filimonas zeae]|uniref:Uncharacterized protein n=2 Tax=Filimonas zeae TaxID=1737353 RepID=A0A917IMS9_9BACT|nr:hypothetical protein GCM10011379_00130 [Filimonas zeae]